MTRNSKEEKRQAIRSKVTFTLSPVHCDAVLLRATSHGRLPVAYRARWMGLVGTPLRKRSVIFMVMCESGYAHVLHLLVRFASLEIVPADDTPRDAGLF